MRFFEILLFGLIALAILRVITRLQGRRWLDLLLLLALGLTLLLHLAGEGGRWQMVPAYLLALAVGVYSGGRAAGRAVRLPRWAAWVGLLAAALFILPPVVFPVSQLPVPGGPNPIGTQTFYWVDEQRVDPYSGGPRRLMVQVWYPAEAGQPCSRAPYMDNLEIGGPQIARQYGLPSFTLSHMNLNKTHSCTDANPAALGGKKAPVLFFSHGWTGIRGQNQFQMEDLASRGYVVFAADHTYGASFTVFPDGTVALNRPDALPKNVSDAEYDKSARILGQTFVADLRFLMDQAEKVQTGQVASKLAGRLDLEKIGLLGHSTGAGAVVETCAVDPRCKAGLTMDAWLIPYDRQIPAQGLNQPFLFMQSELWVAKRNPPLQDDLFWNSKGKSYRIKISGTAHYDFSDLPLLTPLAPAIGLKGPLPTAKVMQIVNTYTAAFFDQTLKGGFSSLLVPGPKIFPEVSFENINQ